MKIPNWFKILWWILLLLLTSILIAIRFGLLVIEKISPFDFTLIIFWIILMLSPLFNDIEIFGVKLKQDIRKLKSEIDLKFVELKSDIKMSQNQNFTANFGFEKPPSDNEIDKITRSLKKDSLKSQIEIKAPEKNVKLFEMRFLIDTEIKRIWDIYLKLPSPNLQSKRSTARQIHELNENGIIDPIQFALLKDIISICNSGIHGDEITEKQYEFVIEYGNASIRLLKNIN